jgi:hypothetical protein
MAKFKFLSIENQRERQLHNGVTDPYLIQLSEQIWNLSDWIYSTMLTVDEDTGQDALVFQFNDIDQELYSCKIYQNLTFELKCLEIPLTGGEDYLEEIEHSENAFNDHTRILDYLRNMPKTIKSSF